MGHSYREGMSLIEIMITMVIIAIIAGIAYPRYQRMVAKSKQMEAKTILQSIHMGEDLFRTTTDKYTNNLNELDIEIPGDTRYAYSISINESGTSYLATAVANIDSDPVMDEWQIDQGNNLVNTVNDVIEE